MKAKVAALPKDDAATGITRDLWLLPLFQELGYGRLQVAPKLEIESRHYPVSHLWGHTPIHLLGVGLELDRTTKGAAGAARMSPHSMVQEFLNRSTAHLWAIVSNGHKLRLLRDNKTLTRQAFVEFDLFAIFEGEAYSDFVLLWLLCHQSRVESERPENCILEKWTNESRQNGVRLLDGLRTGVEHAIEHLGAGFLAHPNNHALKDRLRKGELSTQDYYRQILRQVYRFLFLFVAEDRELLLRPDASESAKTHYRRFYSTRRLRQLAERHGGTRHADLWELLKLVTKALGSNEGCPALGLPALGSFLWRANDSTPDLINAALDNRHLLDAIRALATVRSEEEKVRRIVDYRNLGPEELGSVYESLLELHPEIHAESAVFKLNSSAGSDRKTTGSYYTPDSLVQCLLDSALEPVVKERLPQDLIAAYQWGELASRADGAINFARTKGQSVRDQAILKMTADQLAEAKRRVAEFKPGSNAATSRPPKVFPAWVNQIKLTGISGGPDRRFATINNATFAPGESGTVKVAGKTVAIRCLSIADNSATISLVGMEATQTLTLE